MEVVTRLFWKELRTQAQLWIAMLVGVFLLSLSVILSSGPPSEMLSEPLIGLVYVLTAGFAAASAAVLFAGESEEGQADWLRQLPIGTAQLVTGKAGFGVLATSLLFIASYLVAALVAKCSGFSLRPQFVPVTSSLLCIAGCFIWGVFYSVLMSRVLAVIVAAAATTLFIQAFLNQLIQNVLACDLAHGGVLLIVSLIDCELLARWHRNEVLQQRVHSVAPASGHSLSSIPLKWLVTTGPLEVRRWSVLIWKEIAAALPAMIGALVLLVTVALFTEGSGQFFLFPVVIVLFGLRVFRSEHRENSVTFLSDRGIPATRVWLIKVGVWMAAAAVVIGGFLISEEASLAFGLPQSRAELAYSNLIAPHIPFARPNEYLLDPSVQATRARDLVWTFWSLSGALFVGLFALGQMASFWIRRAILAFAAAFLGSVFFLVWAFNMTSLDIPLSMSVWPAALLLLVATWDTRHFWMEQKTGWAVRRRQLVWILFPAMLSIGLAVFSRGQQVPEKQPGFDWQQYASSLESVDREWTSRWQSVSTRPVFDSVLQSLIDEATPDRKIDPLLMSSVTGNDRAVIPRSLFERFELNFPSARPWEKFSDADREKEVRQQLLDKQLERYKTSLKGIRYLAGQTSSWTDFVTCLEAEKSQLAKIRAWAASENQTAEMLEDALQWLNRDSEASREFDVDESFRQMVKRRYVVLRALYTGEGPIGTTVDYQLVTAGDSPHWFVQSFLGTPERNRLLNLLGWATSAELNMPIASLPALQKTENRPRIWASGDFDYQRRAFTTHLLPPELRSGAAVETSDVQGVSNQQTAILNLQHCRAISVVAIALQWHRLKHGQFPESLAELNDSPMTIPLDPIWDAPFAYTRADDAEKGFQAVGRFILGQPMLKAARFEMPGASKPGLAEIDEWESHMEIQPNRVLVHPRDEFLRSANDNWPAVPEPVAPLADPLFQDASGMGGMEGAAAFEGPAPQPPPRSRPPALLPFDI